MLELSKKFIGENRMCRMTKMSGVSDSFDFIGKMISVGTDDIEYNFISGFKNSKFSI